MLRQTNLMVDYVCMLFLEPPKGIFSLATSHWPQPSPIIRGSSVDLACFAVSGDLPITYSWTGPNGEALAPADTDGIISFTINIYGTYTCTATNQFGETRSTVDLLTVIGNCSCVCLFVSLNDVLSLHNQMLGSVVQKLLGNPCGSIPSLGLPHSPSP